MKIRPSLLLVPAALLLLGGCTETVAVREPGRVPSSWSPAGLRRPLP